MKSKTPDQKIKIVWSVKCKTKMNNAEDTIGISYCLGHWQYRSCAKVYVPHWNQNMRKTLKIRLANFLLFYFFCTYGHVCLFYVTPAWFTSEPCIICNFIREVSCGLLKTCKFEPVFEVAAKENFSDTILQCIWSDIWKNKSRAMAWEFGPWVLFAKAIFIPLSLHPDYIREYFHKTE